MVKIILEGDSWEFPESFGFTGSAKGPVNSRQHPTQSSDEMGDGTYLNRAAASPPAMARGGKVPAIRQGAGHMPGGGVEKSVPVQKVAKAVAGALQVGKAIGQKMGAAGGPPPQGALNAAAPAPAMGAPMMPPGGAPAMRRGGKVQRFDDGGEVEAPSGGAMPGDDSPAMARGGPVCKADGGKVDAPRPTPRPTFGADTEIMHGPDGELEANNDGYVSYDHGRTILEPVHVGSSFNTSRIRHSDNSDDPQNKAKGGFIKGAIKHPGALHTDLGVPKGQKIPAGKLAPAAKQPGKVGQRARFAETLKKINHKD